MVGNRRLTRRRQPSQLAHLHRLDIPAYRAPHPMRSLPMPRYALAILVYAAPVLPAVVAIALVGSLVAQGAGDSGGAYALRWIGWIGVMLLVLDLGALAVLLGFQALREDERRREETRLRDEVRGRDEEDHI
jgi:hypothetical protein